MNDNAEAIGTVEDASHAEKLHGNRVVPGPIAKASVLMPEEDILRLGLFKYYNRNRSQVHFARLPTSRTSMLAPHVDFYEFALLDGKRITATSRSRRNTAGSSLIQVRHGDEDEAYAGEIRHIFRHSQTGVAEPNDTILAHIEWMKRSDLTPLDGSEFPWNNFPQLGVDTWQFNTYADPKDESFPPVVMPLDKIHCQIARGTISHTDPPLWMTSTMDR
ncbi:hypothetical protein B0H16DRAFT_1777103, partial [Mycena metata]